MCCLPVAEARGGLGGQGITDFSRVRRGLKSGSTFFHLPGFAVLQSRARNIRFYQLKIAVQVDDYVLLPDIAGDRAAIAELDRANVAAIHLPQSTCLLLKVVRLTNTVDKKDEGFSPQLSWHTRCQSSSLHREGNQHTLGSERGRTAEQSRVEQRGSEPATPKMTTLCTRVT
ncbi:unnamed protein product [Symbiodinium natans]|uniref:Uncharacterized protein n=1 Tax=Symbiodinium natans TaxID=878477 RepID=A0A812IDB7_9DINO|nr:unnamed protein product [Symbiodinium natans]